ncbi:hypothetical protein TNCV_735811 [Trichonephila clavipes]|uniref:Uncharacterized protein n=1 Tax=Trichonephila clavipes TaxID=2585209 RepID=A0A8X6VQ26_TRICX|nr:hypothetical protein TNCV_735811 [Trichonephila clavipes]
MATRVKQVFRSSWRQAEWYMSGMMETVLVLLCLGQAEGAIKLFLLSLYHFAVTQSSSSFYNSSSLKNTRVHGLDLDISVDRAGQETTQTKRLVKSKEINISITKLFKIVARNSNHQQ